MRGNHGQSMGWAARAHGVTCAIVVPHGNSARKERRHARLGVRLIEHGADFQGELRARHGAGGGGGAHMVPSFHTDCCAAWPPHCVEFFAVPNLTWCMYPLAARLGRIRCQAGTLGAARMVAWSVPTPPPRPTRWPRATWWKPPSPPSWPTAWLPCGRCRSAGRIVAAHRPHRAGQRRRSG